MDDRQKLQSLMAKVDVMVNAYMIYMNSKNNVNRRLYEDAVDNIEQYLIQLKREGYKPTESGAGQSTMFY